MAYRSIRGQKKPQGLKVTAKADDEKVRTHFSNYDSFRKEDSDDLLNDQGVNLLIDPDEKDEGDGVASHFSNYEDSEPGSPVEGNEETEKRRERETRNPSQRKVNASRKQVRANGGGRGFDDGCGTNVSTIQNDENPATGYIGFEPVETVPEHSDSAPLDNPVVNQTAGDPAGEGPKPVLPHDDEDTHIMARRMRAEARKIRASEEDEHIGDPNLYSEEELDDGDVGGEGLHTPPVEVEADDMWEEEAESPAPGIEPEDQDELVEEIGVEPGGAFEGVPAEALAGDEDEGEELVDLLDVDGTPDEDVDGLMFANVGVNAMVIKAGRIIATMTSKRAVRAGVQDEYQSPEFQDSTVLECSTHGLRKGLKNMGYRLAQVNVAASAVINKRVEAKVAKATKQISASVKDQDASFGQCLALASVGLTRDMWKDVPNQLRAGLEENLTRAGLRNASKVVSAAFAEHGVAYTKNLIVIAQKLAAMPVEARNALASAMDMLDPKASFEAEEAKYTEKEDGGRDFIGANASMGEGGGEGSERDWEDELDDNEMVDVPTSVTAALSRAGRPDRGALLTPKQTRYSVQASAVLNGDADLDFSYVNNGLPY